MNEQKSITTGGEHGFDPNSGSWVERLVFNNRLIVLVLCALITLGLAYQSTSLSLQAGYNRMIPNNHPFIQNYFKYRDQLKGLGNAVTVVVENEDGTIFDAHYLDVLQKINDELYLVPGVDRLFVRSLWTPSVRWNEVTLQGITGGPVIPDQFDGSPESLQQLRLNINRSGEVGTLVATDLRSTAIAVPLLEHLPGGELIDYKNFSDALEQVRQKYEQQGVNIYIAGFAKIVGDLIEGLKQIFVFFAMAVLIITAVLFWYTRCLRSALLVVATSLVAVVWLAGLLPTLGYTLDPYSILVPFLIFAIGVSHGSQKMNGIMQDVGRGASKLVASRMTFRRLFLAGLTALMSDGVGFAALMVIDIPVIRDLALTASIGVFVLIFTNLILLPILLSYVGVSSKAAALSIQADERDAEGAKRHPLWATLDLFTTRRWATAAITVGAVLGIGGLYVAQDLKVGDLDPGAPELRVDSRYNQDNAYIRDHYTASSDVLALMISTPQFECLNVNTVAQLDDLQWQLRQLEGVEGVDSVTTLAKRNLVGFNEGYLKWWGLTPNQDSINDTTARSISNYFNTSCDLLVVFIYLSDHKAETLTHVVEHIEQFTSQTDTGKANFQLAAGNAGINAATNIVVKQANWLMLLLVYAAVILFCLITFRSLRAAACAVLPLMLTSVLCEALMVYLGIGVKVATLPVIALGVGIGVDYALYVLSVIQANLRRGQSLSDAYYNTLKFTGRVVVLIGITLAISVATWAWSPIKFQADMGILLAFMFLWNMIGALVLLPALAHFLLRPSKSAQPAP